MIYMRGQARDYDQWAQLTGEPAWALAGIACQTSFAMKVTINWIVTKKPMPIRATGTESLKSLRSFMVPKVNGGWRSSVCAGTCSTPLPMAAQQAGIPATDDFNQGDNEGVGYFEVNQRAWLALEHSQGLFAPSACDQRPNLSIWTDAQVARLQFSSPTDGRLRCSGLQVKRGGELVTVHACGRGDPERGQHWFTATACSSRALAQGLCCNTRVSRWCTTRRALAPICKTICRFVQSSRYEVSRP
jgi:choline dehydrogenase